jgi:hypothetical protein
MAIKLKDLLNEEMLVKGQDAITDFLIWLERVDPDIDYRTSYGFKEAIKQKALSLKKKYRIDKLKATDATMARHNTGDPR